MEQTVTGARRMGRIPKDQRASLHVSITTRERVKKCLDILSGERISSDLTTEDVVNEMCDCFMSKRNEKK